MNIRQLIPQRIYWPKVVLFGFAIVLPAIAVGISNKQVFAAAFPIATIGLIVTVGVSLVVTYFSGNAAPRTRRYAILLDIVIAVILCLNFLFHFQLAREIAAADEAKTARVEDNKQFQEDLDRDVQRRVALAGADAERLKAESENLDKQRRLLVQVPVEQRRFYAPKSTSPQLPAATSTPAFTSKVTTAIVAAVEIKSPEQVRMEWFGWLFWAAAAEIFAAVLGGMVLLGVWQWDVNGDGIPDDQQSEFPEYLNGGPVPKK